MNDIDYIKGELKRLYETAPYVHIRVRMTHPKIAIEGVPAKIMGIYKNIFQIEANDNGYPCRHTFQYGDVLIGQVVIEELDYAPIVSLLNKKNNGKG